MKPQPNASARERQLGTESDRQLGSELERRLEAELAGLAAESQLRHLAVLPTMNFCSNDYLGLASDPRLCAAVAEALASGSAVGSTGSRLLSGNAAIWEQLESELAQFIGAPAALYFGSGYAANVGLFSTLAGPEDVIFSDASNHASIIDGIRLSGARKVIFPHLDLDFLEGALRNSPAARGKFIAVESLFSMEGDRAPLRDLAALAERWGAELIVDEAHSIGVCGPRGRGLVAESLVAASSVGASSAGESVGSGSWQPLAAVYTCGKALASAGAFICCSERVKQYLVNRARTFIFSTALPPYIAAQVRAAIRIVADAEAERSRLAGLAMHLRARLKGAGFDCGRGDSQIVPVILGENGRALEVAARLVEAGFAVRAIRPPTVPEGTARLRLSLRADMSIALLDALADALERIRIERIGGEAVVPSLVTKASVTR